MKHEIRSTNGQRPSFGLKSLGPSFDIRISSFVLVGQSSDVAGPVDRHVLRNASTDELAGSGLGTGLADPHRPDRLDADRMPARRSRPAVLVVDHPVYPGTGPAGVLLRPLASHSQRPHAAVCDRTATGRGAPEARITGSPL